MRSYLVYIKVSLRPDDRIQSYVTPCFSVDKRFWEEQECRRLFVIGSSSSLALAFAIREQINDRLQGTTISDNTIAELRGMAVGFVKETNALYGKLHEHQQQIGQAMMFRFHVGDVAQHAEEREESHPPFGEAGRLLRLIGGRALFMDEVERLSERRGHPARAQQLIAALHLLVLQGRAQLLPGIRMQVQKRIVAHRLLLTCERCGSNTGIMVAACHICEQACAYCTTCLEMGRSKCCTVYICAALTHQASDAEMTGNRQLQWGGEFSPAQAIAANRARQFVATGNEQGKFLIWAVCGAGKTELIFPAIDEALAKGGHVLIATPRKDVVLELAPRLTKAFPTVKVIAVHGSSPDKWEEAGLVISTTHQVMRYYQRFTLVIVDEVDAFPYRGNPMLYRAVNRAKAKGGKQLFLSATPPDELTKKLVRRRLFQITRSSDSHVLLPLRYHGHPLPVPQVVAERRLDQKIRACTRMSRLLEMIAESLEKDRQLFLFVPRIEWIELVLHYLRHHVPQYAAVSAGVHAADPEREQKVVSFRLRQIRLIVTTTILERGVTIPRSDVIVLGAEADVFDEAALVQIAGRVGRSAEAPGGFVGFVLAKKARAPFAAIKQIKRMNRIGLTLRKELKSDGR
ncbi:MAG: DEAD/DEAH box helicase [Clostridia bacterium]